MPHIFKDRFQQSWTIELTLADITKLEAVDYTDIGYEEKINFFPPDEKLFSAIVQNTKLAFLMIWLLCEEQASGKFYQKEVDGQIENFEIKSMEDFSRCFNGDSLMEARTAFYKELPDFFPEQRTSLTALIDRYTRFLKRGDEKITEKIDSQMNDEKMDTLIDQILDGGFEELPDKMKEVLNASSSDPPSSTLPTDLKNLPTPPKKNK